MNIKLILEKKKEFTLQNYKNYNILKENGGIYAIKRKNQKKIYIGKTKNFKQRFIDHLSSLKREKHRNHHLQRVFNKTGFDFTFLLLNIENNEQLVLIKEKKWIKKFREEKWLVYNFTNGGEEGNKKRMKYTPERLKQLHIAITNGSKKYGSKLTAKQVVEIKSSSLTYDKLAKNYQICIGTIYAIKNNTIWKFIDVPINKTYKRNYGKKGETHSQSKLITTQVKEILSSQLPTRVLARKYNVHYTLISGIRQGKYWKHIKRKKKSRIKHLSSFL